MVLQPLQITVRMQTSLLERAALQQVFQRTSWIHQAIATTAALNLKIIGLWDVPNNAVGANAVVVVKINEHLYGSAGVAGQ
jgi:hypothetical protein